MVVETISIAILQAYFTVGFQEHPSVSSKVQAIALLSTM